MYSTNFCTWEMRRVIFMPTQFVLESQTSSLKHKIRTVRTFQNTKSIRSYAIKKYQLYWC